MSRLLTAGILQQARNQKNTFELEITLKAGIGSNLGIWGSSNNFSTAGEVMAGGVRNDNLNFWSSGRTVQVLTVSPIRDEFVKMNFIYSGSDFVIFQNEIEVYRLNPSGDESWFSELNKFHLGDRATGGGLDPIYPFNGQIKGFKVFKNQNIVADYDFSSNTGNTLIDLSANGINGSIVNTPWVDLGNGEFALEFDATEGRYVEINDLLNYII